MVIHPVLYPLRKYILARLRSGEGENSVTGEMVC